MYFHVNSKLNSTHMYYKSFFLITRFNSKCSFKTNKTDAKNVGRDKSNIQLFKTLVLTAYNFKYMYILKI